MPTLKERMGTELTEAMRSRDDLRTSVLRMLKTAVTYKEVELKVPDLDDAAFLGVVGSLAKQRRDSQTQFAAGGRADLAERELRELELLQQFLPPQLSEADLAAEVAAVVAEVGAKSLKDLGSVMKVASARLKGRAEGRAVSEQVRAQLTRLGA